MWDYDARPATAQVVLVGTRASASAYAIRDFLTRNGHPYDWNDVDSIVAGAAGDVRILGSATVDATTLPLCVLPDGTRLESATVEQVAAWLGMVAAPLLANRASFEGDFALAARLPEMFGAPSPY